MCLSVYESVCVVSLFVYIYMCVCVCVCVCVSVSVSVFLVSDSHFPHLGAMTRLNITVLPDSESKTNYLSVRLMTRLSPLSSNLSVRVTEM